MNKAVESFCALSILAAYLDFLHKDGRFHKPLRFALALRMLLLLAEFLHSLF